MDFKRVDLGENVTLFRGDCIEITPTIGAGSVDAVITDPPYPKQYEYLYEQMAIFSKRVLRRGGSLITLCGHYQLARVLPAIANHLKYRWIIKYDQPGSHARMAMGILVTWKPMLWFVNEVLYPRRNITDCAIGEKRSKSTGHPWEQNIGYALWAIESLTSPGDTILDPFMGSGTTGVACVNTGRNFIGIELDAGYFEIAVKRITDALKQSQQARML